MATQTCDAQQHPLLLDILLLTLHFKGGEFVLVLQQW